jgi:phosphoglycolate phosphatase-like HAD superfamily hydrolase
MPEQGLVAVFDIDGVVADVRHRLHHVNRRPKNWAAFFAAADRDPPLAEGIALATEYAQTHALVWLTGRPERLRRVTERWLKRNGLPTEVLFMRPNNDRRPSREFKSAQLRAIGAQSEVAVVVDDDPEVVARLKEHGWPAQLATWVPYEQPLREAQEREGRT